jgi:uncharacterized membrane protein
MNKTRIAASKDGVIPVITTIVVLETKVPHGPELDERKSVSTSADVAV